MKIAYILIYGLLCVSLLTGCNQEQIDKADKIVTDANSLIEAFAILTQSPAGAIFPPIIRLIMEIAGVTASIAVLLWQQIKNKLSKQTLVAIANGVERLSDKSQQEVKNSINAEMKNLAASTNISYAQLNAEVDQAKGL